MTQLSSDSRVRLAKTAMLRKAAQTKGPVGSDGSNEQLPESCFGSHYCPIEWYGQDLRRLRCLKSGVTQK